MKGKNTHYIGPIAVLVFAAILMIAALVDGWSEYTYRRSVVMAKARVIEQINCGSAYGSKAARKGIGYKFLTEDGKEVMGSSCNEAAEIGDIVHVYYLPEKPQMSRLATKSQNDALFFLLGAVLFGLSGLFWLNKVMQSLKSGQILKTRGRLAEAVVDVVMRYQGQIEYYFKDENGKTHSGRMTDCFFLEKDMNFRKGTRIDIRYDPRNPKNNRWFPGQDRKIIYPDSSE